MKMVNNDVNFHGSDGMSGLTVAELMALLRSRGLQTHGKKSTLLKRLRKHLEGMMFNHTLLVLRMSSVIQLCNALSVLDTSISGPGQRLHKSPIIKSNVSSIFV